MGKVAGIIFLWIFSTLHGMAQNSDIQQIVAGLQEKYAPDGRVELFQITASQLNDTLVLHGETTSREAYEELLAQARNTEAQVKDHIRLLPDKALGEEIWGIIYNSAGTLRAEPRYGAELVSQALLGMPVRILEQKGGWHKVQTPDRYIGWMNGSVVPMTDTQRQQYLKLPKVIVTSQHARSFTDTDKEALPVTDLVAGDMLVVLSAKGGFYQVQYPDGREAFVKKSDVMEVSDWLKKNRLTGGSIVNTAKQLLGVPYLWGGTSTKGMDCSGFTKQVYWMHGIILARDASQQVRYGKLIDETGDFSDALPGDLVFFGTKATAENPKERVVHVGIYIGNKRFIHASDYVRINSFDPADPLYDEFNANRYIRTKRVIGEVNSAGIEDIFENSFYHHTSNIK
ncbi:MAG: C40 family peptidase [Porphyromonadaceae bacterium]|nr:C40 family peptidase [Porphyromonadaceae bacterium]